MAEARVHLDDQAFCCPITHNLIQNPVKTALGNRFEKAAIEQWLKAHTTDPSSNEILPNKRLLGDKEGYKRDIIRFAQECVTLSDGILAAKGDSQIAISLINRAKELARFQGNDPEILSKIEQSALERHRRDREEAGRFANIEKVFDAAASRNVENLEEALKTAPIDGANAEGITALEESIIYGRLQNCRFLLQHGANPNHKNPISGWTPIYFAAAFWRKEICELLLNSGAEIAPKDIKISALDMAETSSIKLQDHLRSGGTKGKNIGNQAETIEFLAKKFSEKQAEEELEKSKNNAQRSRAEIITERVNARLNQMRPTETPIPHRTDSELERLRKIYENVKRQRENFTPTSGR